MQIIKKKWLFLGLSSLLILASVAGLAIFGLKPGVDFTGGTLWQIQFNSGENRAEVTQANLREFAINELAITDAVVTEHEGEQAFSIKTKEISELLHQDYARRIKAQFGEFEELSFESIGSAVGGELAGKAFWAFGISLVAIALYIAYAFRKVSFPVSSWKYAFVTLVTLFHDAMIPLGMFAFLGYFLGTEIDVNFIVAILVVIGFSGIISM